MIETIILYNDYCTFDMALGTVKHVFRMGHTAHDTVESIAHRWSDFETIFLSCTSKRREDGMSS